jgi:hypothetical protein
LPTKIPTGTEQEKRKLLARKNNIPIGEVSKAEN